MLADLPSIGDAASEPLTLQSTGNMSERDIGSSGPDYLPCLPGVRRHLRGRRGGLKDMPTMPLDIFCEVRWSLDWLSLLLTLYMIL